MQPPVKNSGPALSATGVQVAVLRQACARAPAVDEVPQDSVEETVEVQVRNGSSDPISVHRDKFRLLTAGGATLTTISANSADPIVVATGDAQTFKLLFSAPAGLECSKELRLDPDAGITRGDSPVAMQPVAFVPGRSL